MTHRYRLIFAPGRIGPLIPKNRLVMPPMVRNYADPEGRATARYVAHIERVARGGVGTIILEASFVRRDGKGFKRQLGVHTDDMVPGLRELVNAGHRHGALIGLQLFHGGRQASEKISGSRPVAPSAIPDPVVNELPDALSAGEIGDIAAAFGTAARRAKTAGFDFVEIHGAHGYLVAQFLSPFSNRRDDDYGGTPEKRRRFLEAVCAAVRAAVGPDFPVSVRLSGEEPLPGGVTLEDTIATARRLEQLGVAALHISSGNYATYAQGLMIPPMAIPDGILVSLAAGVKQAVGIPVIAVGKIRTPEMVEDVLAKGQADLVALGRTLLADPDWPAKVAAGKAAEIRACIACNQGCMSRLFAQESVWCTVNPEQGREQAFAKAPRSPGQKLLVVGGGPAGMAAARWAAVAGFEVVLHEAQPALGGQLIAAAAAPHRDDWNKLRSYLIAELDRLGVEVHLNSRLDAAGIERAGAWAVIVATGAEAVRPQIPGAQGMPVMTGRDVLERSIKGPRRVIVAGGGCAGAQTAEYFVTNGSDVTLLEAEGDIAIDAPADERMLLLGRLHQRGVKLMPNTRLINIAVGNVVTLSPHQTLMLPADMVVLCLGARSERALTTAARELGVPNCVVGDAAQPRKVTDAVAEGALAVLGLLGVKLDAELKQELRPDFSPNVSPKEAAHA